MNSNYSLNKPTFFYGVGYSLWNEKMKFFIKWMDRDIWKAVNEGPFVPIHKVNGVIENKPEKDGTKNDKENVQRSLKDKVLTTITLGLYDFLRVSHCKKTKVMWDILQNTHAWTTEVIRARLGTLTHVYELFRMKLEESINQMQTRFAHIVSHIRTLEKKSNKELVVKNLRFLNCSWQSKVTTISESKDLATIAHTQFL